MILTNNGKLISVGGRLLLAPAAEAPAADLATSLLLVDFYVANANGVYMAQRKAGTENDPDGGHADIEVGFTYSGGVPLVQARVVLKDAPTTVVKDWTPLTGQTAANGAGVGILQNVTAGGKYLLQIRDGNQPANTATRSNGAVAWGVAVVDEMGGQSNMLSTMGAGVSTDIVQGTSQSEWNYIRSNALIANVFTVDGWGEPTSSGLVGRFIYMRMLAKALEAKHGKKIPVGLVLWAIDSQAIQTFLPDDPSTKPGNRVLFTNSGADIGACGFASPYRVWSGDVEALGFHQGEANNTNTAAVYKGYMVQYVDMQVGFFAAKGRTHQTLSFMPAVLGVFSAGVRHVEYLRQGVLDFQQHAEANGWVRMRAGWTTLDCLGPPENTLHFQGEDKHKSVRRLVQSRLYRLDPVRARFDCSGPRLVGTATRSGDVVALPVAGGKTLAAKNAGTITGWYANTAADFSGTDLAVTNVTPIAGAVQITVAGAPSTFYVKHCGGLVGTQASANSDITNLLYEPVEYPFFDDGSGGNIFSGTDVRIGLPLFPTPTPITVT
jgi:hypothetical protein